MTAKKPPAKKAPGRPFEKGKSGNPGGRPKVIAHVRDLARAHTELAIVTLAEIAMNGDAPPSARVAASSELLDRAWGRAPATMAGEGGEGEAQLVIRWQTQSEK
jgi:hypothetical protein